MQAYEKGNAAYFATPPVNLIYAFNTSLRTITQSKPSLEERFKLHKHMSLKIKGELNKLGLRQVSNAYEFWTRKYPDVHISRSR